jgi:protein disulfide-isomerase
LIREKALSILQSTEYSELVRQDEENAYKQGISGVPHFLLDGKEHISGAQPVETFIKAIERLND